MEGLGGGVSKVYFEGKLEEGVALTGEVAGRIEAVQPVAKIIADTVREFAESVSHLHDQLRD